MQELYSFEFGYALLDAIDRSSSILLMPHHLLQFSRYFRASKISAADRYIYRSVYERRFSPYLLFLQLLANIIIELRALAASRAHARSRGLQESFDFLLIFHASENYGRESFDKYIYRTTFRGRVYHFYNRHFALLLIHHVNIFIWLSCFFLTSREHDRPQHNARRRITLITRFDFNDMDFLYAPHISLLMDLLRSCS